MEHPILFSGSMVKTILEGCKTQTRRVMNPQPIYDATRTERVQRRNEELDRLAQEFGFDGLSQFLTAWKNGEIKIIVEHTSS